MNNTCIIYVRAIELQYVLTQFRVPFVSMTSKSKAACVCARVCVCVHICVRVFVVANGVTEEQDNMTEVSESRGMRSVLS